MSGAAGPPLRGGRARPPGFRAGAGGSGPSPRLCQAAGARGAAGRGRPPTCCATPAGGRHVGWAGSGLCGWGARAGRPLVPPRRSHRSLPPDSPSATTCSRAAAGAGCPTGWGDQPRTGPGGGLGFPAPLQGWGLGGSQFLPPSPGWLWPGGLLLGKVIVTKAREGGADRDLEEQPQQHLTAHACPWRLCSGEPALPHPRTEGHGQGLAACCRLHGRVELSCWATFLSVGGPEMLALG